MRSTTVRADFMTRKSSRHLAPSRERQRKREGEHVTRNARRSPPSVVVVHRSSTPVNFVYSSFMCSFFFFDFHRCLTNVVTPKL